MNFRKNFVFGFIGALALTAAFDVRAASQEVIYKIHDIHPLKDDTEITACEFSLTLFNRSDLTVNNLSLDIGWKDDVIENKIKEEKAEKVVDRNSGVRGYTGQSQTEKFTSKMVSTNVSVPPLQPGKQISVRSKINTDRCFLMMQTPELIVRKCSMGGSGDGDKTAGVCNDLFKYVSPVDGEYYTEFKEISYEEEKAQEIQQNIEEKKELDQLYGNAVSSVRRISETLNSMQ